MAEILIVTHLFAIGAGMMLGVWLSRRKSAHRKREMAFALSKPVDIEPSEFSHDWGARV